MFTYASRISQTCDWACINILICILMLRAEVFHSSNLFYIVKNFFYFEILWFFAWKWQVLSKTLLAVSEKRRNQHAFIVSVEGFLDVCWRSVCSTKISGPSWVAMGLQFTKRKRVFDQFFVTSELAFPQIDDLGGPGLQYMANYEWKLTICCVLKLVLQ